MNIKKLLREKIEYKLHLIVQSLIIIKQFL